MKNREVAETFADGGEARTENLYAVGRAIYSYGEHFPIALRLYDGIALFTSDGYSNTTSRHKSLVKRALESKGYDLIFINGGSLKNAIDRSVKNLDEWNAERV